ncbi:MAG: type II toxin-antitoxin system VapC family toxin [Opitutales bacterium]|nr:type II toxin-antitoxin system VapC family toxin [Opitutales bacterium]
MNCYFDTGLLLKLYTDEPESGAVQAFAIETAQPIPFLALHQAECASALHLKAFRGECSIAQANRALADIHEDLRAGVLYALTPDWVAVWRQCTELAQSHAAVIGCRTLDALHVACALELGFRHFVSSDARQSSLAKRVGMSVHCPT